MSITNDFSRNEILHLIWSKPAMAQIELTRNCNQSCSFCFQGSCEEKTHTDLSLNSWKSILKKLKNLGIRTLNYSGGEVYLYNHFEELLEFSKSLDFRIVVNTNGTCDIEKSLPYIDDIVFSIHGLENTHNRITKSNSYETIIKNIKKANLHKINTSVNMIILKENMDEVLATYNFLMKNYKIDQFAPTIAIQSTNGSIIEENSRLVFDEALYKKYFKILDQIPKNKLTLRHGLQTMYNNNINEYKKASIFQSPNCIAGKLKMVIQYDGMVYPCNFFTSDRYCCGDILKDDEYKIWNEGKGFIAFRNIALTEDIHPTCYNCIKKFTCLSGCKAWSQKYTDGGECLNGTKDLRCEFTHAFIRN